jgi:endonuclease/exonuclease/phosphatase family protein
MRLIAWNCNMGLHKKYKKLLELSPDIAVISECAAPELIAERAPEFRPNSPPIWIGCNRHKGLGVFTFGAFKGKQSSVYQKDFPFILPICMEGPASFNLLAVWACHHRPNSYKNGLGPLNRALSAYRNFIRERPTVVAGDFNDNVIWDRPTKLNKHSINVSELEGLGLRSAYHHARGVKQGCEPEPTLYWRNRTSDGPQYHIDYCFVPESWTKSVAAVTVCPFEDWVGAKLSDHVPLIVDVNP